MNAPSFLAALSVELPASINPLFCGSPAQPDPEPDDDEEDEEDDTDSDDSDDDTE